MALLTGNIPRPIDRNDHKQIFKWNRGITWYNRKQKDQLKNVTEEIHKWMSNLWDPDQPVTKSNNFMIADVEIFCKGRN